MDPSIGKFKAFNITIIDTDSTESEEEKNKGVESGFGELSIVTCDEVPEAADIFKNY